MHGSVTWSYPVSGGSSVVTSSIGERSVSVEKIYYSETVVDISIIGNVCIISHHQELRSNPMSQ